MGRESVLIIIKMKYFLLTIVIAILTACQTVNVVSANSGQVEKQKMNLAEMKKLGRQGIINLAVNKMKDNPTIRFDTFNIKNFDIIKIMASNESIYVTFNIAVKYVPKNSIAYYGTYINLTDNTMSLSSTSNPREYSLNDENDISFFEKTKDSEKAISFVLDAIHNNGRSEPEMVIYEQPDYYEIEVVNETVEGGYKINKITGKIYDEYHNHLVPPPRDYDDEIFEEILD